MLGDEEGWKISVAEICKGIDAEGKNRTEPNFYSVVYLMGGAIWCATFQEGRREARGNSLQPYFVASGYQGTGERPGVIFMILSQARKSENSRKKVDRGRTSFCPGVEFGSRRSGGR